MALLQSLIFHFFFTTGTLAEHLFQLLGLTRSESTLSERRQALSWSLFTELLRQSLRPLAERTTHPQAFWRRWRLVAWDGTRFSLTNTPQILRGLRKAKSRRKRAAWAKMTAVVLLELGLHNPLAAAIGWQGESEYALTRTLLGCLPPAALLLADRLCGCGLILAEISAACRQVGSHFLIRARTDIKVRTLYSLPDGSAIVELRIRDPKHRKKILHTLHLREIRVRIRNGVKPGKRNMIEPCLSSGPRRLFPAATRSSAHLSTRPVPVSPPSLSSRRPSGSRNSGTRPSI